MNKSDLVNALSEKDNITEKQAIEIVNLVFDGFADALINSGRIEIRGFGSFTVREYGSYKGRNPKTGEEVKVKPKRSPLFRVGRELKARVDGLIKGQNGHLNSCLVIYKQSGGYLNITDVNGDIA